MNDTAQQNSQAWRIGAGLVLAIALGAGTWWYLQRPATPAAPQQPAAQAPVESTSAAEPQIRHPLEPAPEAQAPRGEAAPPVDPDAALHQGLVEVFGAPAITPWLMPEQLVRRLVATTDNLARDTRTESLRPLRAPGGAITVQREVLDATSGTERITLSPDNARRYDTAVGMLASADMTVAANAYRRLYPLLQRSYEDLGYPGRYFNDRVVEVIDHLLATPEPEGPLLLEQPKVLYRFADADLESRTAGQKLLLRMGVEHARTVKQKLREFRNQIASKE